MSRLTNHTMLCRLLHLYILSPPPPHLPVCNNIFDLTGRPREEFLVFGEPEALQCDFRHSGQRPLITLP